MMEHYLLWIFLLMMTSQHVFGCFPIQDVFEQSTLWSQDLRKPWHRLYTIGQKSDNFMKVEHQAPGSITYSNVTCLRAYSGHRYLVKVELEHWPVMFKCLRFTPLTQRVVRKAETNAINVQARVNCETDVYIEDEELMLAYRVLRVLTKQECPLTGGFQLIPQVGGARIGDQCLDSLHTYNPRMEFACGGDHVLIDFGEKCAPVIPVQDQSLWRMKYSQMECLDSWDEPGGEVKAILLKKRYDYWCLLYKVIKDGNGERLSVYLSFRAKCSGQVFNNSTNQVSTDVFATFGTLVKYVSSFDDRCHKENHIHQCGSPESDSKCFKSNKCPSKCGRCNENIVKNDCRFNKVVGNWISADSSLDLSVNVKTQNIQVSGYGTFYCWKYNTSYGDVYPVVRNDAHSSCLPLYACAKLSTPCLGVLNFFLTIDKRDSETGKPLGCSHLPYGESILIPPMNGMVVTLLDTKKLPTVSCNIQRDMLFPSSQFGRCKFLVKKSIGSCSTLNAGIDFASCGTDMPDNMDREHTCHAKIQLLAGVRGIITSSVHNNRYRCWIFTKSNLYITSPDKCNSKSADEILQDYRSANRYDPFLAIIAQSGDDANCPSGNITMYIIVLACWLIAPSSFLIK